MTNHLENTVTGDCQADAEAPFQEQHNYSSDWTIWANTEVDIPVSAILSEPQEPLIIPQRGNTLSSFGAVKRGILLVIIYVLAFLPLKTFAQNSDAALNINSLTTVSAIQSDIQEGISMVAVGGGKLTVFNADGGGSRAPYTANATMTLNIPANVTVIWDLEYSTAGTFTTGLINITGDGAFEVAADGSLVRTGPNETLTVTGAATTITVRGTVSANSARAIHLTGANSAVIVDGGTVSNNSSTTVQAAIYIDNTANNGLNVTVKGNGKVLANAAGGYAIMTYGDVEINDNAVVSAHDGGVAIDALGDNSTVTINGGTVSTTGGQNTSAIGGSAINCHSKVVVNGGTVSATTGKAIHTTHAGGTVEINGGTVWASTGYAIRDDSPSSTITVNGGFVFAYGTSLTEVTNRVPNTVTDGVVVAWNPPNTDPPHEYIAFFDNALTKNPADAEVVWYDDGAGGGIAFAKGDNTGFFPLYNVTVEALQPDENGVLYVDHTIVGGNGSSWADAYPNLADPLLYAAKQRAILLGSPSNLIKQIWIAEGTYYPMYSAADYNFATKNFPNDKSDTNRDNAFVLIPDLKIYGGFVPTALDPLNPFPPFGQIGGRPGGTILSGDIGIENDPTDNAYTVVIAAGNTGIEINGETLLDGITISGGNAVGTADITVNGRDIIRGVGGGMYNAYSSPTLNNITISGNSANIGGGGMHNYMSSPALTNATVSGNSVIHASGDGGGGGISNDESVASFINVTISGNSADYGGGIYSFNSDISLTNVLISGNSANNHGGGIYITLSSPVMTNVTISGNSANNGGGIYNVSSNPVIINSIIWGNTAATENNINNITGSVPVFSNSLIEGSGGSGVFWVSSFGADGDNNIDQDPDFYLPELAANAPTTAGDYRLSNNIIPSPAIDAGDRTLNVSITDLAGNPRLNGDNIDMGAYENQDGTHFTIPKATDNVLYVDHTKDGDGSSWDEAYQNLSVALLYAAMHQAGVSGVIDSEKIFEIRIAEGTYKPEFDADEYHFENKKFPSDLGNSRDNAFVLAPRVRIYGGFKPNELIEPTDLPPFGTTGRNVETVLSGDIGTVNDPTDNAYHVVIGVDILPNDDALLDGVTITGGNADGIGNITVNNKSIVQNSGGGLYNVNSSPVLNSVKISGNSANDGGGLFNDDSSPTLINIIISENSANDGGGIFNENSSPTLTNVTISGNSATNGGGIYNDTSSPEINNSIIWGNTGDNVYNTGGGAPAFSYSLIEGGIAGVGNIDSHPRFVDPALGDYRLRWYSPAINKGDDNVYMTARGITNFDDETDIYGNQRHTGIRIDMGAYEYPELVPTHTGGIVFVVENATGDGSSWENAFPDLATPLLYAAMQHSGQIPAQAGDLITEIRVAEGVYMPMYDADGFDVRSGPVNIPTNDGDRDNAFVLVSGVKIYGGFVPNELDDPDDLPAFGTKGRNGETQLSGGNNAFHVIIGADIPGDGETLIDGITITGGNANGENLVLKTVNGSNFSESSGGGIYNINSSPVLNSVTISGNNADVNGGGMYNYNSSPVLINVTISGNSANSDGGGIYTGSVGSGHITALINVLISGNSASVGGGMYNVTESNLTNVTVSGNNGGGLYNASGSNTNIYNSIIWENIPNNLYNVGGGGGSFAIYNSINQDADPSDDPRFVAPLDPDDAPIIGGDYRLRFDSHAAINMGNNLHYLTARGISNFIGETDLAGNLRLFDTTIDMGAYEFQIIEITSVELYVVAPQTLQSPFLSVTGASNFTIETIIWEPDDDPYHGGKSYTVTISLKANETYSFDDLTTATINGETATISISLGGDEVTLSRIFTTEKLDQEPLFITDPGAKIYGDAPFQLSTTGGSTNGAVTYNLVSGLGDVTADGEVTINGVGEIVVTATMAGDEYYNPVTSEIFEITVNPPAPFIAVHVNGRTKTRTGDNFRDDALPSIPCNVDIFTVLVETNNPSDEISINGVWENPRDVNFSELPLWGDNILDIIVRSPGEADKPYTLTLNKPIPFDDKIVVPRWDDNRLTVINDRNNNGYDLVFDEFRWFVNGAPDGVEQTWPTGVSGQPINANHLFRLELRSVEGDRYRTCEGPPPLNTLKAKAYPNPVSYGQTLWIEANADDSHLEGATVEVYNSSGVLIDRFPAQGKLTSAPINYGTGLHLFVLRGKDGFGIEFKITVQ